MILKCVKYALSLFILLIMFPVCILLDCIRVSCKVTHDICQWVLTYIIADDEVAVKMWVEVLRHLIKDYYEADKQN